MPKVIIYFLASIKTNTMKKSQKNRTPETNRAKSAGIKGEQQNL